MAISLSHADCQIDHETVLMEGTSLMALRVLLCCLGPLLGLALLGSCNRAPKSAAPDLDVARITKIKVNRDGIILLNDHAVTIQALKDSLSKLGQSAGSAVWYFRE